MKEQSVSEYGPIFLRVSSSQALSYALLVREKNTHLPKILIKFVMATTYVRVRDITLLSHQDLFLMRDLSKSGFYFICLSVLCGLSNLEGYAHTSLSTCLVYCSDKLLSVCKSSRKYSFLYVLGLHELHDGCNMQSILNIMQ